MSEAVDIAALRASIGREERAEDVVTPELVKRFAATCDIEDVAARPGDIAPPGLHWCLAPAAYPNAMLAADGHPTRGGFLPPIPLPRRMWAGGELQFEGALRVGDEVTRLSRIDDVRVKEGRTGVLCFVTVRHELGARGAVAIVERQDIVYRGAETGAAPAAASSIAAPRWTKRVDASETRLFRYSALTFNAHRIHYDRRYATEVEGYPGLVVHGPMQATLLLLFAREIRGGAAPAGFAFRSGAPIFDDGDFSVNAEDSEGGLSLWTANAAGQPAMNARATWRDGV